MKQRTTPNQWIPLWIDKWLFGSTRIELTPDERSVWVDLMVMGGKDDGYIRANEGCPYPLEQLAGLLLVPVELLERTIEKCLDKKIDKLERLPDGTLRIKSWETYELSERHYRRLKTDTMSGKPDIMAEKTDTKIREEKRRKEKNRKEDTNASFALNQENLDSELKEISEEKLITPKINFNFEKVEWENITDLDKKIWKEAYPACDIELDLAQMKAWLLSNPEKKKKNYRRFITNWLSRSQEKGGTKNIVKKEDQDPELRHLIEGFGEHQGRMMYERMKRQREEAQNG